MKSIEITRFVVHYSLHLVAPLFLAFLFVKKKANREEKKKQWRRAVLLLLTANLVDADHLLANPVFSPNRCSVGYHLLHSYFMIAIYFIMLILPTKKLRISTGWNILAFGLLFHMAVDWQDYYAWPHQSTHNPKIKTAYIKPTPIIQAKNN